MGNSICQAVIYLHLMFQHSKDESQFYEIGVVYHGHHAKALPFIVHEGYLRMVH